MSIRSEVITQFEQVAREQDRPLAPLAESLELLDSGLDSLCLAIIVARLEDALGMDPFSIAEDVRLPDNLGRVHQVLRKCRKVMVAIRSGTGSAPPEISRIGSSPEPTLPSLWALGEGVSFRGGAETSRTDPCWSRPGINSPRR